MIYFQEKIGSGCRVISFRHKTQQEFLTAKFIYRQVEHPEGRKAETQMFFETCENIENMLQFEKIIVFLAGMCNAEDLARNIMKVVTKVFEKFPELHIRSEFKATDLEDTSSRYCRLDVHMS